MGYPIVIEPHPGWKPPTRVARLDDYLRKPKQKSKLSKELREYEEGDTQDEICRQEKPLEKTNHQWTFTTSDASLRPCEPREVNKASPLEEHTTSSKRSISDLAARFPSKPHLELAALPVTTTSTFTPRQTDALAQLQPRLLRRYLTDLQDSLDPTTAQHQQNLIDQQAVLDQQRLIHGLDPCSYQAKGKIISIYSCTDGLGWKIGAAIEVVHAPLGFPNQEVWLWESMDDFNGRIIMEGTMVLFGIVWEAVGNHWEVVELRG